MVQPNPVGHARGIFETEAFANDHLIVTEPMLPSDHAFRGVHVAGVAIPQHVADWAMPIYGWDRGGSDSRLVRRAEYLGGEHFALKMSDMPGWSVAYAARHPRTPLAFACVKPVRRLPFNRKYVFTEFGVVVPDDPIDQRRREAAAALMYCAIMDEPPSSTVCICSAENDMRSGQVFQDWGMRLVNWAKNGGVAEGKAQTVVSNIREQHPFVNDNLLRRPPAADGP